jgi:putative DNA primase/helicase
MESQANGGGPTTRVVASRTKVEGAVKAIKAALMADRWSVLQREFDRLVCADYMTREAAERLLRVAQETEISGDVLSLLGPFLGEPIVAERASPSPEPATATGPRRSMMEMAEEAARQAVGVATPGVEPEHRNTEHHPEIATPAPVQAPGRQSSPQRKKDPARPRGLTENEILDRFRGVLDREGIVLHGRLIANGRLQRCAIAGKAKSSKDGAYKLSVYRLADGSCAAWGGYQNWRLSDQWLLWEPDGQEASLTRAERAAVKAKRDELQRQEDDEERQRRAKARDLARHVTGEGSTPLADDHDYLVRKGVRGHGLRAYKRMIVVPLVDIEGDLHSAQLIHADGTKRFLLGGRKEGCFHVLGEVNDDTVVIIIVEGFATGATIYEITGLPVVLAMDAGNLPAVATAIRCRYTHAKIIIAGDDDWKTKKPDGTPHNKGRIKAIEAANVVGGIPAFPTFGSGREDGQKDFNDMVAAAGKAKVHACLMRAVVAQPAGGNDAASQPAAEPIPTPSVEDRIAAAKAKVNELRKLDAVEYAVKRKETSKALGIPADMLDDLVRKSAEKQAAPAPFPHWNVEPWQDSIDGGVLLGALVARIRRHVVMGEHQAVAVALWIMLTWVHEEAAVHSPILLVTSAEPNSGKSTLCGVVGYLARRGLFGVTPTGPALFRSITQWLPTFVIDEADNVFVKNDDLKEVTNSGWTRGQGVLRVNVDTGLVEVFPTFAPKMVGMKGRNLPNTTLSRSVVIEMSRALPEEVIEQEFGHVDDEGLQRLRSQLCRWADDNAKSLASAKPEMVTGFYNRTAANWKVLLAIAESAGGTWKDRARSSALAIENVRNTFTPSQGIELLANIRAIFAERNNPEHLPTATLLGDLNGNPEWRWATINRGKEMNQRALATRLKEYKVRPEVVHPTRETSVRGYALAAFQEPFKRYLGSPAPAYGGKSEGEAYAVYAPLKNQENPPNSKAYANGGAYTSEKGENPNKINDAYAAYTCESENSRTHPEREDFDASDDLDDFIDDGGPGLLG